jgi:endonuclease III
MSDILESILRNTKTENIEKFFNKIKETNLEDKELKKLSYDAYFDYKQIINDVNYYKERIKYMDRKIEIILEKYSINLEK